MAHLNKQTQLDYPAETVQRWLSSAGARQRLTPAYLGPYPGTANLKWTAETTVEDTGNGTSVLHDHVRYQEPATERKRVAQEEVFRQLLEYRSRQLQAELRFAETVAGTPPMVVAITGASGMVGTELTALLQTLGHTVRPMVRRPAKSPEEISYNVGDQQIELDKLAQCDAVINLAGESIFGRYTTKKKQAISTSRIMITRLLSKSLDRLYDTDGQRRTLVSASAIGFYGAHASHGPNPPFLTETEPHGDDVLAKTCLNWEETGRSDKYRSVQLRMGLVLTAAGGLMGTLLPLVSRGLAGSLGEHLWNSWVSVGDACRAYVFALINEDMEGPYNVVNDNPILNDHLIKAYADALGQTSFLPVPSFAPKLILGSEGADVLALASQRVDNQKIKDAGFRFSYEDVHELFRHILPEHPTKIRQGA